jgi:hypothetical protein
MTSKTLGLALGAVVLAATACSSNSGKVSVSAKSVVAATSGSLDVGNGILVDRVRIAIRKVKLEGAETGAADAGGGGADDPAGHHLVAVASDGSGDGADAGSGGDGGHDGEDDADEVKVGPFLVDLAGGALSGGITQVFDGDVPAGTYRELRVVVDVVQAALAGSNAALVDMGSRSVIIDGTVDGTAFSFESSLRAEQKRESTLTVDSSATTANLTLSIDPSGWFKAADGTRLDPTAAASKSQIENNIKASVDAFCDHDRDGHDDRGGDGSGHQ